MVFPHVFLVGIPGVMRRSPGGQRVFERPGKIGRSLGCRQPGECCCEEAGSLPVDRRAIVRIRYTRAEKSSKSVSSLRRTVGASNIRGEPRRLSLIVHERYDGAACFGHGSAHESSGMAAARPVLAPVAVPCQERETLLRTYTAALHSHHADVLFHAALLGTKTTSGILTVAEYRVEESRHAFIAAREAYVAHLLEHACDHRATASAYY